MEMNKTNKKAEKTTADWLDSAEGKRYMEALTQSWRMAVEGTGPVPSHPQGIIQPPIYLGGVDPYNVVNSDGIPQEVDVAVIHADFRSVADKLLEEAKELIAKAKPDERAARYTKLGFTGTKRVQEHNQAMAEKEARETLMRRINDYRVKYPTCQFLDEASLIDLCEKYGLGYAPAEYFNQDIPEKNLRELEAFELKSSEDYMYITEHKDYQGRTSRSYVTQNKAPRHNVQRAGFEVVATKDMFNIPSDQEWHGSTIRERVKDPIVLQRVPLGFLIVTAWGPEAELPEVNTNNQ